MNSTVIFVDSVDLKNAGNVIHLFKTVLILTGDSDMTTVKQETNGNMRSADRREILANLQVYLTLPHLGNEKINLRDISEDGLSFYSDPIFKYKEGDTFKSFLHINQNLKLSISIKVRNIVPEEEGFRIGCKVQFQKKETGEAYRYFVLFLNSLLLL